MSRTAQSMVVRLPIYFLELDGQRLDQQSRICNWLYNHLLEKSLELKNKYIEMQDPEIARVLYTERGLRNLVPGLKKDHLFLKTVHSSPLKNSALRLSAAIKAHQQSRKKLRKGKKAGWPRFRSWKRSWFSLLFDEPGKGFRLEGQNLTISLGSGLDRKERKVTGVLQSSSPLKGKEIRNFRLVKQLEQFFAVFTVHVILPEQKEIKRLIALDPNHKNLAYGVDTENESVEIAAPSWLKKLDQRIDEIASKRDRCKRQSQKVHLESNKGDTVDKYYWKPSRRWAKLDELLEKLRRKRREQTKTFLYTVSQKLFKRYDLVAIGDYTPDGSGLSTKMRRAMNNQSLIARFKHTLSWVAQKSGKTFCEFDEKGTTRTCHQCAFTWPDGLCPSIRTWTCPSCQTEHIRDENSAQNGLQRVLRDLKLENLVPGSGPVSVMKRWAWCALPRGVQVLPQGQSSDSFTAPRNLNEDMIVFDQNRLSNFA
ncbi:MAG: transposase [Waddliaceae bacterium]|nr:transposase [Waddliaceae bacterium]